VAAFVHEESRFAAGRNAPRPHLLKGMREALTTPGLLSIIAALFAVQFAVTQVYPILPQFVQYLQGSSGHAAVVTGAILLAGSAHSIGFAAGPLTSAGVVALSGIREVFLTAAVLLGFIALWVGMKVQVETEVPAAIGTPSMEAPAGERPA
jgi:hypothetical protein